MMMIVVAYIYDDDVDDYIKHVHRNNLPESNSGSESTDDNNDVDSEENETAETGSEIDR